MRPRRLEEVVGQAHLIGNGRPLSRAFQSGRLFSIIFWGPPGSGKTTLARLAEVYARLPFRAFSAVTSGLKELREVIQSARLSQEQKGQSTILFVDEIHRFNKAQQDAFLPHVESGLIILIGATTQNPSFEVIPPLLSRVRVMVLHPLSESQIHTLLTRALEDRERGLGRLEINLTSDALRLIGDFSEGDARVALNNLEAVVNFSLDSRKEGVPAPVDVQVVQNALSKKPLPYDKQGEEHYNLISAFHKSLRGGDTQASLYWLYRMLVAGEDPLFISRRMIRVASEDVGLADPQALQVALASFDAWQKVGPPEAELALAQAAVYLAAAPKSNGLYLAEKSVKQEIERSGNQPVPLHIRNAATRWMGRVGYGRGYRYPHDYPGAWVRQEYLPAGVKNRSFYRPSSRGFEKVLRERLQRKQE
jgi:putative ATPase